MKSVLFIAAALMIGASIYGFVNYRTASRQKEFKTMYDEKELKSSAVIEEKTQPVIADPAIARKTTKALVKTEKPATKKAKKKKRKIDYESFSRGRIERFEPPVIEPEKGVTENRELTTKEQ